VRAPRAVSLGLIALAGTVLLASAGTDARAQDGYGTPPSGDFAGLVRIADGRHFYLECYGTGSPTVILEAGLRGRGDIWSYSKAGGEGTGVLPRVASFTHVCRYDRPGTLSGPNALSRSDPAPMPRSTGSIVADLHELLTAAGVPGPYVIAGSSTGGLIARQYASTYPDDVLGLVLVDAISEAVQSQLKPQQFALYNLYYLQSVSDEAARYRDLEEIDFYRSFAEMRLRPRPPHWIPIAVISKGKGFGTPAEVTRRFGRIVNVAWKRAQIYLASLEPEIRQITARGSGHQVHVHRPGLVTRMIRRVIAGWPKKPARSRPKNSGGMGRGSR
jgi:pimeloyl-ACP methyl ester carboxylesterase